MGDHRAIADVGESLVSLLGDRMADLITDDQVVLASPVDDDLANTVRLTLYLFDVQRSTPKSTPSRQQPPGETPRRDSLSLDLSYLLTAHPGKENSSATVTSETKDEHTVLGRAMQVLHDNALVDGPDLKGSLSPGDDALQVTPLPETTDTVVNLWNTFQNEPYRPSVPYLVTPVEIESRREAPTDRVEQVRLDTHRPAGGRDG